MTQQHKPLIQTVIEDAFEHRLMTLSKCQPAKVLAYNPPSGQSGPSVDVQPALGWTYAEEGRELSDTPAPISGVPLLFPGSGPYRLTFPVAEGDWVLLVYADRSTDEWVDNGNVGPPADLRKHDPSDAFAIPGVLPNVGTLSNVSTSVMVLGKNGNAHQPAARKNDAVKVTINTANIASLAPLFTAPPGGGPCVGIAGSVDVTGTITAGSADVEIT